MATPGGQKLVFGSVRERKMASVVAERSHPERSPPVVQLVRVVRHDRAHPVGQVVWIRHDVEDPRRQIHHAQRMLEASMRRAGIDQIAQGQLVNVPQSLKRPAVDDRKFRRGDLDEHVQRVS